jgi:translation initiation factor IF-3
MGILDLDAALAAAQEQGLDLVEVAPTARPPVVRIMDYGKFKFEQAKMARQAKKKQHVIHLKEVKYRPGIEDHDFETKTRHARRFLGEGNKVKVTLMFRGRQIAHPELGKAVVDRVAADLADVAKIESDAKMEGRPPSGSVAFVRPASSRPMEKRSASSACCSPNGDQHQCLALNRMSCA